MMTDADKLQQLWDRHQIEALNHIFGRSLDGGSVEDYLSIFAPDVDYRTGPKQLRGHAALRDFFESRAAQGRVSRHLMCQLEVTPIDATRATARSSWLVFAGVGDLPIEGCTPFQMAEVADELVRSGDGWLITRREITSIFRNSALAPGAIGAIGAAGAKP